MQHTIICSILLDQNLIHTYPSTVVIIRATSQVNGKWQKFECEDFVTPEPTDTDSDYVGEYTPRIPKPKRIALVGASQQVGEILLWHNFLLLSFCLRPENKHQDRFLHSFDS